MDLKDISILLISSLFIISIIYIIYQHIGIRRTYTKVSQMLEDVFNENFSMQFPDSEEELLSKMQAQVNKLHQVYLFQRKEAQDEKIEIQKLISDISHQIKTPLANVKLYSDLLKEDAISPAEKEEFMLNFSLQLQKLEFLTESLIKMSRLESGVIQILKEKQDINKTILKAIGQVYQKAIDKGISISFEEGNQVMIAHDSNWTAEAVFNLIDNAIKYSDSGTEISINIEKYDLFVRVNVKDEGIGIDQKETNDIFKRFYRGNRSRDVEGIGIGLYLTRKIVQSQGGYLKVKSSEKGSEFSLFLPNLYK